MIKHQPASIPTVTSEEHARRADLNAAREVDSRADLANSVSWLSFAGFVLTFFASFFFSNQQIMLCSAAAGFLILFIAFQIITQLLRIRAELIRKN